MTTTYEPPKVVEAREKLVRLNAELETLRSIHGEDDSKWAPGIRERAERLITGMERQTEIYDAFTERGERIEAIRQAAMDPNNIEEGTRFDTGPSSTSRTGSPGESTRAWQDFDRVGSVSAWSPDQVRSLAVVATETMDGLEPAARESLATMLDKDRSDTSARFVLAMANPSYRSAFDKWIVDPMSAAMSLTKAESAAWRDVAAIRAAMGESGASALLPLQVDPAILLINNGSTSDVRQYAKRALATSNSYRTVTSAGVTAEFKVEGAEAADASPTVAGVDIPVFLSDASVKASFELVMDTNITSQLGEMFADAFKQQEDRVFILGAGTTEPFGAVTRLSATTGSRVSPTTASVFTTASGVDLFKVRDALPARYRQSASATWASNIAIQSVIQQMGTANQGPNSFWADMRDGSPDRLLGKPILEATSMTGTIGAAAVILALVDWSRYLIADRLGTTVQVNNVTGSNGRSTAQYEYFAYRRYGADLLDFNAGRVLKL